MTSFKRGVGMGMLKPNRWNDRQAEIFKKYRLAFVEDCVKIR